MLNAADKTALVALIHGVALGVLVCVLVSVWFGWPLC